MKLRIRGDSLRLRLSQSDVQALREHGTVEDTIHFGLGDAALTYVLCFADRDGPPSARYEPGRIVVELARAQGEAWAGGDEVGVQGTQSVGDRELTLLVEKDFKCLAPREGEEEYDGFANPLAGKASC